jgi:molybdopterin/thiamine biosynthesis adenylyltransferase
VTTDRGVLVIGAGGLGAPVLSVLAQAGVARITLVDDDRVEVSNLQRQLLFSDADVGRLKVDVAAEKLRQLSERIAVERVIDRFVPENARSLVRGHALVVEGSDNYATKFLAADAARLAALPVVQAGAVRFAGWALASAPGASCIRCLFEDIPGQADTCAAAGVLGPVVGVLGALEGALAIDLLRGRPAAGTLWSYDALGVGLRKRRLRARDACPLCSGAIRDLDEARYLAVCN